MNYRVINSGIMMTILFNETAPTLFDYKPERLVVTGYRCAMAGYEHGDAECWDTLWQHYVADGGLDFARDVMGSLQYWVRSLRQEAGNRTYYPNSCRMVCRDECLVLALLSAKQYEDHDVAQFVLQQLVPENDSDAQTVLDESFGDFATTLERCGQKLMAVPFQVIQSIVLECRHCPRKLLQ